MEPPVALEHIKTPFARSLNAVAERRSHDQHILDGKSLPCTVAQVISSGIVVVNFEVNAGVLTLPQIKVPILAPEYIRYPIQVGDRGLCVAADARLGGLSGLGSGTPDLSRPSNLAALGFLWLGSTEWSATDDPQAVVIYGPNGVVLRDTGSDHKIVVNTDQISLDDNVVVDGDQLAFFGGSPVSKETITGALSAVTDSNAKAVLTSIIMALTGYSLTTNGTS